MKRIRSGLCAVFLGLATVGAASAATAGLGQSWPNTPDLSRSPRWHVYVFQRDGARYVQINDRDGRVLGAFAVSGHYYLPLPMGAAADRLSVPGSPVALPSGARPLVAAGETIYQDGSTLIRFVPLSSGGGILTVSPCDDPAECSTGNH